MSTVVVAPLVTTHVWMEFTPCPPSPHTTPESGIRVRYSTTLRYRCGIWGRRLLSSSPRHTHSTGCVDRALMLAGDRLVYNPRVGEGPSLRPEGRMCTMRDGRVVPTTGYRFIAMPEYIFDTRRAKYHLRIGVRVEPCSQQHQLCNTVNSIDDDSPLTLDNGCSSKYL